MISRFEERYYNDINSLASTMPRVVELLEKLVDSKVPSTDTLSHQEHLNSFDEFVANAEQEDNAEREDDTPRQTVPGTRLASNNSIFMHSRPINWNPDDEDELDLAVVFKNDKGDLVVTPICTRCNYRYSAYSRNGTDWNCQNCGYEWQTNNNFSPLNFSYYKISAQTRRPYDREQFHQGKKCTYSNR